MNNLLLITRFVFFINSILWVSFSAATEKETLAYDHTLFILSSLNTKEANLLTKALVASLHQKTPLFSIKVLAVDSDSPTQLEKKMRNNGRCIITVGKKALQTVLNLRINLPIFSTLVPKSLLDSQIESYKRIGTNLTGIYQEQSFVRQLYLAKAINQENKNIIIFLGHKTRYSLAEYQRLARQTSLNLDYTILKHQLSPQSFLDQNSLQNAFMLIINDDEHHTSQKLQSILLTSYRNRIPIIGSKSHDTLDAAMASVITPTAKLVEEVSNEMVKICNGQKLPSPHYSRYFEVEVNQQIADYLHYGSLSVSHLNELTRKQESQARIGQQK